MRVIRAKGPSDNTRSRKRIPRKITRSNKKLPSLARIRAMNPD